MHRNKEELDVHRAEDREDEGSRAVGGSNVQSRNGCVL